MTRGAVLLNSTKKFESVSLSLANKSVNESVIIWFSLAIISSTLANKYAKNKNKSTKGRVK